MTKSSCFVLIIVFSVLTRYGFGFDSVLDEIRLSFVSVSTFDLRLPFFSHFCLNCVCLLSISCSLINLHICFSFASLFFVKS